MRKVRVEKEMPGLDVGQEFNFVEGSSMLFKIGWVTFESKAIDKLISGGWLSWVEEERSLSEIVHNFLHEHVGSTACLVFENKIILTILLYNTFVKIQVYCIGFKGVCKCSFV